MDTLLMSHIAPLSSNNLTPTLNHGCPQRSCRHLGELFYLRFSTVRHSYPLDHLVVSQRPRDKLSPGADTLHYCVGTRNPPLSMACPQGFIAPLWRLLPLPENHKEMMRESSFPTPPAPSMAHPSEQLRAKHLEPDA